ncbi:MAG: SDR family NAD(P)-dependent oxidoreductase [Cytophagaceae bacterium]
MSVNKHTAQHYQDNKEVMNIFITGATGYIGELLAIRLANEGHSVHALVRSVQKAEKLKHPNISIHAGDILDNENLIKGMKGCDAVFHLAACATVCSDDLTYYDINVGGTKNIMDAAVETGIKKVIFTSTAGVFGPSDESGPVNEKTTRNKPFFNDYEATKAEAEELVLTYKDKLHVCIVNPTRVYGIGEESESNAVTKLIKLYKSGKWRIIPGNGKRIGNYVYVEDVVKGHILALKKAPNGSQYLLGGENASYSHLFKTIAEETGIKRTLIKMPVFVMLLASAIMVWWAKLRKKNPLITPKWVKKYLFNWEVSSQKAIDELGYTITSLSEGILQTDDDLNGGRNDSSYTLITGASSGIGKSIAEECARRRQNLLLVALPDSGLDEFCARLEKRYRIKASWYEVDLTKENSSEELLHWCVENNYQVKTLINNAGMGKDCSFSQTPLSELRNVMLLNMDALVSMTRTFAPELKKNAPAYILNVGSVASFFPIPFKCVYAASKSFVYSFSKALTMELKPHDIHVSCLCPGPTDTNAEMKLKHKHLGWKTRFVVLSPEKVASRAVNGLYKKTGIIIPGWTNRLALCVEYLIPSRLSSLILIRGFKKSQEAQQEVTNDIKVRFSPPKSGAIPKQNT